MLTYLPYKQQIFRTDFTKIKANVSKFCTPVASDFQTVFNILQ